MHRRFLFVLAALFAVALLAACASTEPMEPEPDVETAGFEYPAPPDEGSAAERSEMENAREMNRRLQEQVDELKRAVADALAERPAPESAPAVEPAPAPDPEHTISAAELRRAFRRAHLSDLEVGTNTDGEAFVLLQGAITFASGQARLTAAARTRLQEFARIISEVAPDARLRVEGHTDSDPIRKSNWGTNQRLSEARAKAVASFLVTTGGLSSDRVEHQGYGADDPIASNATAAGKARNRRVEIVLVD